MLIYFDYDFNSRNISAGELVKTAVFEGNGNNYRPRNPLLKNGVNSLHIKRLHENWTIRILDTGYWLLDAGKRSRSRSAGACAACRSSSIYKIDRIPR